MLAASIPDPAINESQSKGRTVQVLEAQVKKLEKELESKDELSRQDLRAIEQKYNQVKVCYSFVRWRFIGILVYWLVGLVNLHKAWLIALKPDALVLRSSRPWLGLSSIGMRLQRLCSWPSTKIPSPHGLGYRALLPLSKLGDHSETPWLWGYGIWYFAFSNKGEKLGRPVSALRTLKSVSAVCSEYTETNLLPHFK